MAGGFFVSAHRLKSVLRFCGLEVPEPRIPESEERGERKMADYKHPEVLVSTEWVANNLKAPNTRLVEVDVDTTA
jgi:hypothetical protein